MQFEKPDLTDLETESDVEQKFLYPILTSDNPSGLGYDSAHVSAQKNLRKFVIGKGKDQKSYFPDYLIIQGGLPLLVVEGKKPNSDLHAAFREARLYATELNAVHPSGLNPASRIIASDGLRLMAGWYDQSEPVLDIPFSAINPYTLQMDELVKLFGANALKKHYLSLLPKIKATRHWKPVRLVGGLAKQKELVPINSFGATITTDFAHLFNPQSRADRRYIARHAYISSKRRERYVEPIDKVIRAATPPSVTNSKTIDDTGNPSELVKPFRNARALEQKIMLLIGSAGAGKSTFVDYLQEMALPADIRSKTLWIRIDMNPAPISRDEVYAWLREALIAGCVESNPEFDFASLEGLKAVHSVEINAFRKGVGRLYEKTPSLYDSKLADMLTTLMTNRHTVAINTTKYCSTNKGILLVIVLDNSDKRLREEQLLMFEAAQWLQREFRGLVILPLREETYDNHRNEPPLDTALKDLVFRIEPPLFQRILFSRVNLALRELARGGTKMLRYKLPNGFEVEYPASEQGFYFSSILKSIFEHDRYVRRLIVGLSGRNMRRALEIFLEFCTSGHIGADELTKIRLTEGKHILSRGLVTSVLLRVNQRYYDSDASYLKNVFAADIRDARPSFFSRLIIMRLLIDAYNAPTRSGIRGYVRVAELRNTIASFGVDDEVFRRELQYLVRGFCVVCEDFSQDNIMDDDLVAIAPAGHVHLEVCMDHYYLAAVAEDSWFNKEAVAQRIADRITDTRRHFTDNTTLCNAEDVLEALDEHRSKEVEAYSAMFENDMLARLLDLSTARSRLMRFEADIVSDLWVGVNRRYPIGSKHLRPTANSSRFGLFITMDPGVEGLIHSSKLPVNFESKVEFERGSLVHVRIIAVDRVKERIELDLIR